MLAWVLRDFNPDDFFQTLAEANYYFLIVLAISIIFEQLIRAFKWSLILSPFCNTKIPALFGAIMVGYFSNYLAPLRISPIIRAVIIAKFQKIRISTALASIGVDRITDGFVFIVVSILTVYLINFPVQQDKIQLGIIAGTGISLIGFLFVLKLVNWMKNTFRKDEIPLLFIFHFLSERWKQRTIEFLKVFVESFVMPKRKNNILWIFISAVLIKLVAVSHFYWVGLSYKISLEIWYYLFLMVFLGYLIILVGVVRITGGFTAGVIFVLQNFGISTEEALAMTLTLFMISKLSVIVCGTTSAVIMGLQFSSMRKMAVYRI